MSQAEDISKGEAASTLLESALFNEAFDTLEASIVDALLSLPIEADNQRIKLACMHQATQRVRSILGSFVADGQIARADILEEEQKASRLKRIMEIVRHG